MVIASLLKLFPHSYGAGRRVLNEIKMRLPHFQPKSFLDYGAGLGSGATAFHDIYPKNERIVCIDPSNSMRKLGKLLYFILAFL